jgi:hypothetical protein
MKHAAVDRTVTMQDETPPEHFPRQAGWLDTYCFEGYDPGRELFFHLHMSTWQWDRTIWRELVLIAMPDGTYAVHEGYGRAIAQNGTFGSNLRLACVEPGVTWEVAYHGPVQLARHADLLATGGLAQGPSVLVDLRCTYTGDRPVWSLGDSQQSENYELGASHYEQPGTVVGQIRLGGARHPFQGYAYRDKSRGARSLEGLRGYCWMHGRLDNGTDFALLATRAEGSGQSTLIGPAAVWTGGMRHSASCPSPPLPTSSDVPVREYSFGLEYAGRSMKIDVQASIGIPYSFSRKNDWFLGKADTAAFVTFVESIRLTCDGVPGVGISERSIAL